eukprot:TRINITY_DN121137_c0_g1_i1.p1 TRINITY_DN121137_c0_g1~~TRINITY_DN121137_c0_g1_i1.p1  ORF type:complete len:859 (+),score=213.42 TRINITY_DN121137_c0_g1_i1:229-2805(+)
MAGQVEPMLEREMDECLEGIFQSRDMHDLVILSVNMQSHSDCPRDTQTSSQVLSQLTGMAPRPDVVCVQDGLEGMDILSSAGYRRVASSTSQAKPLRDMVYGSEEALITVPEGHRDRFVVNELYVRADSSNWEVVDSGLQQISSELMLNHSESVPQAGSGDRSGLVAMSGGGYGSRRYWPLAPRSVVWSRLRRRGRPVGPNAFVYCTRFSGGRADERLLQPAQLGEEGKRQADRTVGLFAGRARPHPADVGVVIADLGTSSSSSAPVTPPPERSAPAMAFGAAGWSLSHIALKGYRLDKPASNMCVATNLPVNTRTQAVTASGWQGQAWPRFADAGVAKATVRLHMPAETAGLAGTPQGPSPLAALAGALIPARGAAMQGTSPRDQLLAAAAAAAAEDPLEARGVHVGPESRYSSLRQEHRELVQEHRAEEGSSEALQALLSSEMVELRDSCQEKGQAIGVLTSRLSETAEAVTAELQSAALLRKELEDELADEQQVRMELEASCKAEEAEAEAKEKASEQQLAAMLKVRDTLEAQIRTSLQIQANLRDQIDGEKSGCSELEVAGERELVAWREHNARIRGEMEERGEATEREVERLRQESQEYCMEEAELESQLESLREAQEKERQDLQAEAMLWHYEVMTLSARVEDVNEETREGQALCQRLADETAEVRAEKQALEEEIAEEESRRSCGEKEFENVELQTRELHDELSQLRDAIVRCRRDDEHEKLIQERDEVRREVQAEAHMKAMLESEIEAAQRSSIFPWCRRRQPPPPSPARGASSPGHKAQMPRPNGPPRQGGGPANGIPGPQRAMGPGGGPPPQRIPPTAGGYGGAPVRPPPQQPMRPPPNGRRDLEPMI